MADRVLSLTAYALPEWFRAAPASWEARLREISPVTETLSHLRFRWRDPHPSWHHHDQGVWELYSCTPRAMVHPERAEQFKLHWSELPEGLQPGRKAMVSDYQHWMWHTHGVEAKRFWVLQGWGGTPAQYTRREQRILDAVGAISEPFPFGFFPPCPFDERSVSMIVARDRLYQVGNRLDELEKLDRPAALKAEDEAAEKVHREKFLDTWYAMIQPQAEFMKSYLRKSESDMTLKPGTREQADAVAQWKDHYIEHGTVIGAKVAGSRSLQVAVA